MPEGNSDDVAVVAYPDEKPTASTVGEAYGCFHDCVVVQVALELDFLGLASGDKISQVLGHIQGS